MNLLLLKSVFGPQAFLGNVLVDLLTAMMELDLRQINTTNYGKYGFVVING